MKLNRCSCSEFFALSFYRAPIMALIFGRTSTKEQIMSNQAGSCAVGIALLVLRDVKCIQVKQLNNKNYLLHTTLCFT